MKIKLILCVYVCVCLFIKLQRQNEEIGITLLHLLQTSQFRPPKKKHKNSRRKVKQKKDNLENTHMHTPKQSPSLQLQALIQPLHKLLHQAWDVFKVVATLLHYHRGQAARAQDTGNLEIIWGIQLEAPIG